MMLLEAARTLILSEGGSTRTQKASPYQYRRIVDATNPLQRDNDNPAWAVS